MADLGSFLGKSPGGKDWNQSTLNAAFGRPPDEQFGSGAFAQDDLTQLGGEYADFLRERLRTPVTETERFRLGRGAIRDSLTASSATARQRLSDAGLAGGFADSGVMNRGNMDIDRAEMQAFSSSIRDLIMGLEDRRGAGVLPYLAAGSREHTQTTGINVGSQVAVRGQNQSFANAFVGMFGCWVARAVFGEDNQKWLEARRYVLCESPGWFYSWYMRHGEAFAEHVKRSKLLRWGLRPLFKYFAWRGRQLLAGIANGTA